MYISCIRERRDIERRSGTGMSVYSELRIGSRNKQHIFLHGFEICLHTQRGTSLMLFTALRGGSTNNSIASRKTKVFLASARYS